MLASQTEWSREHISRFRNFGRVVGRVSASRERGAAGRRSASCGCDRAPGITSNFARVSAGSSIREMLRGIISLHLVESDPELSKNLNNPDEPNPGAGDWYILIDGTQSAAVWALIDSRFKASDAPFVSTGAYRLLWDLAKSEL